MNVIPLEIPDVLLIEPNIFSDERGFFFESYNHGQFQKHLNYAVNFVQDNQSRSVTGVLRGLHYQLPNPQGKLVRVLSGKIFDVAVDIRSRSETFGLWVSHILSAENMKQLWIPEGFAHGFYVLSDWADVAYKTTDYYCPTSERGVIWSDVSLAIDWPFDKPPILAEKDSKLPPFELVKHYGAS